MMALPRQPASMRSRRRRRSLLWRSLLWRSLPWRSLLWLPLLGLGCAVHAADDGSLIAGVFSPPRLAPEFMLRGSDGGALRLSRYRGKVVVLAFGYTSCTEVCPVTLGILAMARKQLGAAADGVQVIYVTVDPDRDNVQRMHEFLAAFDRSFMGATGTPEQLAAVRGQYGITVSKKMPIPGGYVLSHSSFVYLIDRGGHLRALMPFGRDAADFAHDLRILLQQ